MVCAGSTAQAAPAGAVAVSKRTNSSNILLVGDGFRNPVKAVQTITQARANVATPVP
jgi:hypothetical protein